MLQFSFSCLVKNEIWFQQSLKFYKYFRDFICLHFTWLVIAGQIWLQTHRHHHRWFKIPWHHKPFKFLLTLYTQLRHLRVQNFCYWQIEMNILHCFSFPSEPMLIRSDFIHDLYNDEKTQMISWTMSSSHWYIISYNRDITDTSDKNVLWSSTKPLRPF